MNRWVLLLHELPDRSWHYDWMMQSPPAHVSGLITFRVFDRPDEEHVDRLLAERLPDHREVYLEYEGVVSGGRGTVRRVAGGLCRVVRDDDVFVVELLGDGGGVARAWVGTRADGAAMYNFAVAQGLDRSMAQPS